MNTNFIRKATTDELMPQYEFIIEKTIVIDQDIFNGFIHEPLNDYDFILENLELIYCDKSEVFHTSLSHPMNMILEYW